MSNKISAVWTRKIPYGAGERVHEILQTAGDKNKPLQVFFRADDIAHVDGFFTRLMHIFLSHEMPLCLAVVPKWLDRDHWKAMEEFRPASSLWCWHQHGWDHSNHEKQGKKCEFGDSRSRVAINNDLAEGMNILGNILGDLFYPAFTPPWNRCGRTTLDLLRDLDFKAVSRSKGAKPAAAGIMPDFAVNVDLHTRRETDFNEGWLNLLAEFAEAAASGRMGIMLHHQRMNEAAFVFLDVLLSELLSCGNIVCSTFREL